MKVAHVIVNLSKGGGQRSTIDLIRSTSDTYDNYLILLEDFRMYDIDDIKSYSLCKDKKKYKKLDFIGDYLLSLKLSKLLRDLKIDVVISHMEVTAKVVRYINIPKILYMRVDITQELDSLKNKSLFRYKKRLNLYKRLFDNQNLITISDDTRKNIIKKFSPKKIETIYNPFDRNRISHLSNEKIDFEVDNYLIQIGSGIKRKRQDILLEAFSKIENKLIKLLLLGTEENNEIKELISKYQIDENRVLYIPFSENPYPYIKNAKVLIMSSEREGLPRVIVESLILKTPVVSTDCDTGPREVLVDELSDYLAKVNDSDDLANKINIALKRYPTISDKYIENFDSQTIKAKFVKYLENLS